MSLVKKLSGKALIVAMAMAMLPASVAVPQNVNGAMGNVVASLFGATEAKADPWRHRHWDRGGYRGGGYYGRRDWRDSRRWDRGPRYYRRDRGNAAGAAIIGGIVGLGVGAAIASANQPRYVEPAPRRYVEPGYSYTPQPWTREWYQYCSQRYRSFDPGSGTFQQYNGPRRMCR